MSTTDEFRRLAERIVDDLLAADPVGATALGDHRFDGSLPDLSAAGVDSQLRTIDDHVTALDAVDDVELDVTDFVDLEILRARLLRSMFELDDIERQTWDPMVWNPGTALHLLLSRDFAPADVRAESLRARLADIPDHLASGRAVLGEMSQIHLDTAIAQLNGTRQLIETEARELAGDDAVVARAVRAVEEFVGWLDDRRPEATRSPRLGERLYAGALWHALDDSITPDEVVSDARDHLVQIDEQLRETAREYLGADADPDADDGEQVREALRRVADEWCVTNDSVLPLMRDALERTTEFVRQFGLVTVPDVEVRVIEMPEIHRGVAVAYCDAPGPLETADVATYVAVAPTPSGWDEDRVRSFYREYNGAQLHDLAVHEAMPGHVLQLAHAQQLRTPTRVRRFGRSGVFIEGWAVYAEEVMIEAGYRPSSDHRSGLALRLQQLKMQARSAINAILDVGVHAQGMTEAEGLWLMRELGMQEESEATGKWRRALLTSAQLPTYFVGYRAVHSIIDDLCVMHGEWDQKGIHDLVLSHGSPAPRHLRTLLGI